jgi:hypothetical protein
MWSPAEGARPTASAAVRMLGGENAGGIKVPSIGFSAPKYDWRRFQRWNISASRLPAGSEVLFREPSAWERYSWQIALITAVILVQAGLSRFCCRSIVVVGWRRCRRGSAWRNLPCQPLLHGWRTDRLHRSRNQPTAWGYPNQRRKRTGHPEISET